MELEALVAQRRQALGYSAGEQLSKSIKRMILTARWRSRLS